ncbi:unnamed protein product, partial [Rotaria sp. Silwood1]
MTAASVISLVCPLTNQIFREPVIAEDGFTYEKDAIREWIKEYHTSPKTKQELKIDSFKPNTELKSYLENFGKALVSKDHNFKLNTDVEKERRALFNSNGKSIFKASWLLTKDKNGPPIVILKLAGVRAQVEATFYEKLARHPHILQTYGFVKQAPPDPNSVMLLQEYAPEGNLYEVLEDQPSIPTESVLCEIFMQVSDAMKYLSHNNVIHGDLACRNVLVFRFHHSEPKFNLVKVADFGLSKGASMYSALNKSSSTTSVNIVPVRYAAPEVLASNLFSMKSDIYSMGVLMWEAHSKGMFPWMKIENDEEVRRNVIKGDRLSQPESCSNNIWSIALKCMSEKPEDRPNFSSLYQLLSEAALKLKSSKNSTGKNPSQTVIQTIDYPSGSQYIGEMKDGKRHGKGVVIFENGNRYEGQFFDGKRHGHGIFSYANGRRYEGQFCNGEFHNDKFHGHGLAKYEIGDYYVGDFVKDKRHGRGAYMSVNSDRYEGIFENGKLNGTGTI